MKKQMNMIRLDIQLMGVPTIQLTACRSERLAACRSERLAALLEKLDKARGNAPFQNATTLLRTKHKMQEDAMPSVSATPVMQHRLA